MGIEFQLGKTREDSRAVVVKIPTNIPNNVNVLDATNSTGAGALCSVYPTYFVTYGLQPTDSSSMNFSGKSDKTRGLPFPSPRNLPKPEWNLSSCISSLAGGFFPLQPGKP